ncbi:protein-methionine sulfoxide oxidase mical2b isoform X2 [Cololabis saira]|uniref:protein-methionine sulfoxide oxidase mical2b isoform X2 n=1 Tax=Cololabis saira TaxID=129043 RepID=UPI002AD4A78B|nr:protein-methionine sulfoxide oxidase mical2b isoform X2 [Cololabis saira]
MSAVKALQQWCRLRCEGYRDVAITNMTTSFRDGLAFCALIHKHRPDLINFDSLKKENVYENNKLAFKVAEEELGIPALLDAEDMVALKVPDRLSILTYVSQYYNYFHGRSPIGGMGGMGGIKRPAEGSTDEIPGKKNQAVVSKVFPASKPARENSPPPSFNITRPSPSPKQARKSTQDAHGERSHQTGTLSNKCVSCNNHVHLVQRHLVEGKLYHRNCAKLLASTNTSGPFRDLPPNTHVSKLTPPPHGVKTSTTTPAPTQPRLGPSWMAEKPSPTSSVSSKFSTSPSSRPTSSIISAAKESPTAVVSKLTTQPESVKTTATTPAHSQFRPGPAWLKEKPSPASNATSKFPASPSSQPSPGTTSSAKESLTSFVSKPTSSRDTAVTTITSTRTSTSTTPTPAPRTSVSVAKTRESKLKFFQLDKTPNHEEKKTTTISMNVNKGQSVSVKAPEAAPGQLVSVVVNVKDGDAAKITALGGRAGPKQQDRESNNKKASAAAFISKTLTEENNNNNSKPSWTTVALKKTDNSQSQVQTPKKEPVGVRAKVKLKVDPSILADLQFPEPQSSAPGPGGRSGLMEKTPDRGGLKPGRTSPITAASDNESPADWRMKLKPISKEPKPAGTPQSSTKPWSNGAGKTSEVSVGPSSSTSHVSSINISVTPPASKGFQNGQKEQTVNPKEESKVSKTKPDYIPKEEILKELDEIEDNVNELEKRGVELEMKLRSREEEGVDDSVMDELMVEWFSLIRNKQLAMRRESELVYIGRTQDLEEEQPTVEQELRRLMEKPEHFKTSRDREREKELMEKLLEIVNDRNAIIDGLDEDRLREEEEDEELNKMMMNFNVKKDKTKKKSPMSKLFSWGSKKEG